MKYRFDDPELSRLFSEKSYKGRHSEAIVKAFRKRVQFIQAARDIRDFAQMRSLRFEELKGKRKGEYSIRLNKQWRLIFEIETKVEELIAIKGIEDYH